MSSSNGIMTKCQPMHAMAPRTFGEAMEFAKLIANSSLVPQGFRGKPADILVAIQLGHSVGLPPIQSLQYIAVINGKPCLYGDAALAIVRSSPLCVDVTESFDSENNVATCIAQRKGSRPVERHFGFDDAKRAGLLNKQGPWSQYPQRMAQMRARGFALRDAFPDVLLGLSMAEEAEDIPQEKTLENISGVGSWRQTRATDATEAIDAEFSAASASAALQPGGQTDLILDVGDKA